MANGVLLSNLLHCGAVPSVVKNREAVFATIHYLVVMRHIFISQILRSQG